MAATAESNSTRESGEKQANEQQYACVPQELRERRQWVCYKRVPKAGHAGKFDKVPVDPQNGNNASIDNPSTWGSFAEAVLGVAKWCKDGIGDVFADDDPYAGVDLDGCRDKETGTIATWAVALLAPLAGGYAEVSPSETGVHVLVRGTVPAAGHKTVYEGSVVEMYDHGRFFTVTGQALPGAASVLSDQTEALQKVHDIVWADGRYNLDAGPAPDTNGKFAKPLYVATGLPDEDVLERCRTDRTGELFSAFYDHADLFDVDNDDSRADWFVWNKLAFYLGDDMRNRLINRASGRLGYAAGLG
jgi:putative DNA primase/helicase